MKHKHSLRPNIMNHKTDLMQVYQSDTIVVELGDESIPIEVLDLYFSNKKRSGGENVIKAECVNQSQVLITFADPKSNFNFNIFPRQFRSKKYFQKMRFYLNVCDFCQVLQL